MERSRLGIRFHRQSASRSKKLLETALIYPFAFAHHGTLPAPAEISIQLTEKYANKQVYVYYLNEENSRLKQRQSWWHRMER